MNEVQTDCTGMSVDYKVGELRVWRGWRLDNLGRLTGIQQAVTWKPTGIDAECLKPARSVSFMFTGALGGVREEPPAPQRDVPHPAPEIACTCGLYHYYDNREDFPRYGINAREANVVFGIAEVWGRILVGSRGLRAQYARPVAIVRRHPAVAFKVIPGWPLTAEKDRLARMARNYPDVAVFNTQRAALKAFPLYVPEIDDKTDPLFWERSASA